MPSCRLCNSDSLVNILDLGSLPIAHKFEKDAHAAASSTKYPMNLQACSHCGLGQIEQVVPPEILYADYNFCFSEWKHQPHMDDECNLIMKYFNEGTFIEVGCNDGLFLNLVNEKSGFNCIGIEPNKVACESARGKGLTVINKFFESARLEDLQNETVNVIIARQVLEHIEDVAGFLIEANKMLNVGGLLCIEVPDTDIALEVGDISCMWEEHMNYFTAKSLINAIESCGFDIQEKRVYPFSGQALFILASKKCDVSTISLKQEVGIDNFKSYASKINDYKSTLHATLPELKSKGFDIVMYGSGCRASTIIHGLDVLDYIDHVVDDQLEKQGLFMAGTDQCVKGLGELPKDRKYVFLLAVSNEHETQVAGKIEEAGFLHTEAISVLSPKDIRIELDSVRKYAD